jgi:uncharacterized protein YggE
MERALPKRKPSQMKRPILAAAFLLAAVASALPAVAADSAPQRVISISGHGEVRVVPDMAVVNVGVTSQAATAADSLAANTKAMQQVMATLDHAGIAAKDIQTSNFSIQPRYDYGNGNGEPAKLVGYDVSNNVTVTVRKIDGLGAVLDQVVQAGSNQINGIAFQVAKPDPATDEARKLAVADATRRARTYAAAAGLSLGPILSLTEQTGSQPPVVMQARMLRADAAPVPIAAGEQAITADVNIVWQIQ